MWILKCCTQLPQNTAPTCKRSFTPKRLHETIRRSILRLNTMQMNCLERIKSSKLAILPWAKIREIINLNGMQMTPGWRTKILMAAVLFSFRLFRAKSTFSRYKLYCMPCIKMDNFLCHHSGAKQQTNSLVFNSEVSILNASVTMLMHSGLTCPSLQI